MMSSRFDPGSTSKTLNLFLLRFNERSRSENLGKNTSCGYSIFTLSKKKKKKKNTATTPTIKP